MLALYAPLKDPVKHGFYLTSIDMAPKKADVAGPRAISNRRGQQAPCGAMSAFLVAMECALVAGQVEARELTG
jgi:hypothetical protein